MICSNDAGFIKNSECVRESLALATFSLSSGKKMRDGVYVITLIA